MATRLYIGDSSKTPAIVKVEEVPKTKFGVNVDTWIGEVDENGVLKKTTWTGTLNFAGVKKIGPNSLFYTFYGCTGITSVNLSSLQSVGNTSLNNTFNDCTGITSVDLSSLTTVDSYGLFYTFYGCTGITSVNLSSLQSIGQYSMQNTFYGCRELTTISFPSLTDVQTDSFGSSTSNSAFRNCSALTEIHFRADMQATIEALTGYADKFGATNATIYFDL